MGLGRPEKEKPTAAAVVVLVEVSFAYVTFAFPLKLLLCRATGFLTFSPSILSPTKQRVSSSVAQRSWLGVKA